MLVPLRADAVLPPDLVVSVGSQVAGFFSFFAVLIGSAVASLGVVYLRWYPYFSRYAVYVAFGVLAVLLIGTNYYLLSELREIRSQPPTVVDPPDFSRDEEGDVCDTCKFYGDSLVLFSPDEAEPFVLDMTLNRIQEPNGKFTQYYFLDGYLNGESVEHYTQFLDDSPTPRAHGFLTDFNRETASDKSVRDRYRGEVVMNEQSVSFQVEPVAGDFLSRNRPTQTQYHSTSYGEVTIDGKIRPVHVLAEALQSTDFRQDIFFDGYDELESLTHQLILWAEDGDFYLIDRSVVSSDTPAYPSHDWLLYKEAATGFTKKAFMSDIVEHSLGDWTVYAPDFRNATIEVEAVTEYQPLDGKRDKWIVRGTIKDERGTRAVSGIMLRVN